MHDKLAKAFDKIFEDNNTLNYIGDTYFPSDELARYVLDHFEIKEKK